LDLIAGSFFGFPTESSEARTRGSRRLRSGSFGRLGAQIRQLLVAAVILPHPPTQSNRLHVAKYQKPGSVLTKELFQSSGI